MGIEFRNEMKRSVYVTVCKSKLTGQIYVHIGKIGHCKPTKIKPHDYAIPDINCVDY